MAKIRHDRENCIGCGSCASLCPEFWSMDADGKSMLKGAVEGGPGWFELELREADLGCNRRAAESCPVSVIHIL